MMDEDSVQQTLTYFEEMQQYFAKRNKRTRKERAYNRKGLPTQDDTSSDV